MNNLKKVISIVIESLFSFVPLMNVIGFLDFSENKIWSKYLSTPTQRGKYDTQLLKPLLNGKS
jgi:hypothetical protein